jgi:hypothetical protein
MPRDVTVERPYTCEACVSKCYHGEGERIEAESGGRQHTWVIPGVKLNDDVSFTPDLNDVTPLWIVSVDDCAVPGA